VQHANSNKHFSPAFIYNQLTHDPQCIQGISIPSALDLLNKSGVPTIESFPYDPKSCDKKPTQQQWTEASLYRTKSYSRITEYGKITNADMRDIKIVLSRDFPVVIAAKAYVTFTEWWKKSDLDVYTDAAGAVRGNHAMVTVGYDD